MMYELFYLIKDYLNILLISLVCYKDVFDPVGIGVVQLMTSYCSRIFETIFYII